MWKDAYLDSRILSADPIELIHILYEHTLTMLADARRCLAAGDIQGRGRAITRTIAAIDELDGSLDRAAGGSIAKNLGKLYQYMRLRLLTANIRQEDAPLAEVENLLGILAEGWSGMQQTGTQAAEAVEVASPFGRFTAEPEAEFAAQGWNA
jgi:flagellar protein FliS